MQLGSEGEKLIKGYEKLRLTAYNTDGAGVLTIGWGHTKGVKRGDTCTREQADAWFLADASPCMAAINRYGFDLNQNQFDALVSLLFNCGTGVLTNFVSIIRAKNWDAVTAKMAKYVYANGVKLNGLVDRRQKEIALFNKKALTASKLILIIPISILIIIVGYVIYFKIKK